MANKRCGGSLFGGQRKFVVQVDGQSKIDSNGNPKRREPSLHLKKRRAHFHETEVIEFNKEFIRSLEMGFQL